MKKSLVAITVIFLLTALTLFWPDSKLPVVEEEVPKIASENTLRVLPQITERAYANDRIANLAKVKDQCVNYKHTSRKIQAEVASTIVDAMVSSLNEGLSEHDLHTLANSYRQNPKEYLLLVKSAVVEFEKLKIELSVSSHDFARFQGLEILKDFDAKRQEKFARQLQNEGRNINADSLMPTYPKKSISIEEATSLLSNTDFFNTFFDVDLRVQGAKYVSPSVLFVMAAEAFEPELFVEAINGYRFTVHDLAVALIEDLPLVYFQALYEQVESPTDMPFLAHERNGEYYRNIADIAAAMHNVEALEFLRGKNVTPVSHLGVVTGLDFAIHHLPYYIWAGSHNVKGYRKYRTTIEYLASQGYELHGSTDEDNSVTFFTGLSAKYEPNKIYDQELKEQINQLVVNEVSSRDKVENEVKVEATDLATVIEHQSERRLKHIKEGEVCKRINEDLLAAQEFATGLELRNLLRENYYSDDINGSSLHEIDPSVYDVWTPPEQRLISTGDTKFTDYLFDQKWQLALEYVSTNELNQFETDSLVQAMVRFFEPVYPIWKARIVPKAPLSISAFSGRPIQQWQQMIELGLDDSLIDANGRTLFDAAIQHKGNAVELLLELGWETDTEGYGSDVFDYILDKSYEMGRLSPYTSQVFQMVKHIEPNHYARIVRLQQYFPEAYEQLIELDDRLIPPEGTKMNRFSTRNH